MLANQRATKLTTKMAAAEWTCAEEDRLVTLWQEKQKHKEASLDRAL